MSKQLAAKLLINKMNKITNPNDRKKHLINCLDRQGFIKEEVSEIKVAPIKHDLCRICKSDSIIFSNNNALKLAPKLGLNTLSPELVNI